MYAVCHAMPHSMPCPTACATCAAAWVRTHTSLPLPCPCLQLACQLPRFYCCHAAQHTPPPSPLCLLPVPPAPTPTPYPACLPLPMPATVAACLPPHPHPALLLVLGLPALYCAMPSCRSPFLFLPQHEFVTCTCHLPVLWEAWWLTLVGLQCL